MKQNVFAIIACCILWALPVRAVELELTFDTLPSAEGWTYESQNGAPEASIFSVANGILYQNSMGTGTDGGSGSGHYYKQLGIVHPSQPYTLSLRARVLQVEGAVNGGGFSFRVGNGSEYFHAQFRPESILLLSGTDGIVIVTIAVNNTVFHNYRFEGSPGLQYDFYIDNALVASGLEPWNYPDNVIAFGDITNFDNGVAEVSHFSFSQGEAVLSLPDLATTYGEKISVPLSINSPTDILSAEAFIAFDSDLLTPFSSGVTATALTASWSIESNLAEGMGTSMDTLKIAMATDDDEISGIGDLVELLFTVADRRSPANSPLTFTHVLLNDGNPQAVGLNGSVTLVGNDGQLQIAPEQIIPRQSITVTVDDIDENRDADNPDAVTVGVKNGFQSESLVLDETGNDTHVFTGTIATVFSLASTAASASNDGIVQAMAGDQITFTYEDSLDGVGITVDRTAVTQAIGGVDGAISVTVVSQPGDTVRVKVADSDLNTDPNVLESAVISVINLRTGETESILLEEFDGGAGSDSPVFFGTVGTAYSSASTGDGIIATQKGDVIEVAYWDEVTALGDTVTLVDDDEVVDPFGDADANGEVQAFDAAKVLLHVLVPHLTGLDSLSANLDLLAYDPALGKITPFDAALILQKRVGLIGRFPVQEDEADNHPQPQTDQSTPKLAAEQRRLALLPGDGYLSVWIDDRENVLSGDLLLDVDDVVGGDSSKLA